MNKKKNLLNIFTQDASYNYHLVKTEEPKGHLIYLGKKGSNLDVESLEFSPTKIAEELIIECDVEMEKFAPSIFFSEETNTEKLKYLLNNKLSEDAEFSAFINSVKDEYRILVVKDCLLFKNDPQAYEAAKQKEYEEHQKELWEEMMKEHQNKKSKREKALLEYDNNFEKLLKEYLESIIEYEKRDFELTVELDKIVGSLIDPETWIKINDKPFNCRIEVISLKKDIMNVFLTDNNDYSYTATLRFDKTVLVTENPMRLAKEDKLPVTMNDYEVLAQLYDVDLTNVKEWDFKNDTDRFEYVIDYLTPIFKEAKDKKEKEYVEKALKEEQEEKEQEEKELKEKENNSNNNTINNNKMKKTAKNYMFDVFVPAPGEEDFNPLAICLVEDKYWNKHHGLSDSLGSHNLPKNVIKSLENAGVFGEAELMESIWEVVDTTRTKQSIIDSMVNEGFVYTPNIF